LHGHARRLSGPFANVSLPGRPILLLSALDRLKIFLSFFGYGAAKKSAEGEDEWKRHVSLYNTAISDLAQMLTFVINPTLTKAIRVEAAYGWGILIASGEEDQA